jgi:hypothetical protein
MMMMLHVVKALGGVIDGAARIGIRSVENVGDAKSRESMAASHAEYLSPKQVRSYFNPGSVGSHAWVEQLLSRMASKAASHGLMPTSSSAPKAVHR